MFSDLTPGGLRSSVQILLGKKYVIKKTLNGQSFFIISDAGKLKLRLLYPDMREERKNKANTLANVLLIIESPGDKKKSIRLRKLLHQYSFTFITRGAYFYPFEELPESLFSILVNEYSSSVMLIKAKEFSLAKPDLCFGNDPMPQQLKKSLSGVSSEIQRVTDFFRSEKYSTVRAKKMFCVVCKKIVRILEMSPYVLSQDADCIEQINQIKDDIRDAFNVLFFSRK